MDQSQRVNLLDLPPELFLMIRKFLREADTFHFSLVNRKIYGILDCEWFFDRSRTDTANYALEVAAMHNHIRAAKKAILEGADINSRHKFKNSTSLMLAAQFGHTDIVKYLLDQPGIAINASMKGGDTALHFATKGGYTDIVRSLVAQSGIDINVIGYDNQTALQLASQDGHTEIVAILQELPNLPLNLEELL